MGELGDIEFKQEEGDYLALGNACVDGVMFGCGVIVSVDSCMAPKVRGQSYSVVLHVCVVDVCKESCLVHSGSPNFSYTTK